LAGLILAGGRSRRFGRDKAFEKLNDKPLIDYVVEALAPVAGNLIVVADSAERFVDHDGRFTIVTDEVPGLGPLGGLYAGLKAAPDRYSIVAPCDSPFIDTGLVEYMLKTAADANVDALVPRYEGREHTVNAVYSKACVPAIDSSLNDGLFRISSIFDKIRVQYIDDDTINKFAGGGLSFFNVNTPENMDEAGRILRERGGLNG